MVQLYQWDSYIPRRGGRISENEATPISCVLCCYASQIPGWRRSLYSGGGCGPHSASTEDRDPWCHLLLCLHKKQTDITRIKNSKIHSTLCIAIRRISAVQTSHYLVHRSLTFSYLLIVIELINQMWQVVQLPNYTCLHLLWNFLFTFVMELPSMLITNRSYF